MPGHWQQGNLWDWQSKEIREFQQVFYFMRGTNLMGYFIQKINHHAAPTV